MALIAHGGVENAAPSNSHLDTEPRPDVTIYNVEKPCKARYFPKSAALAAGMQLLWMSTSDRSTTPGGPLHWPWKNESCNHQKPGEALRSITKHCGQATNEVKVRLACSREADLCGLLKQNIEGNLHAPRSLCSPASTNGGINATLLHVHRAWTTKGRSFTALPHGFELTASSRGSWG